MEKSEAAKQVLALRRKLDMTQKQFAETFGIPRRTLQNWECGVNTPKGYILALLDERVKRYLREDKKK